MMFLRLILDKTYQSFDHENIAPLINIEKNKYVLELFYGPTLAFKDYALQFLGKFNFSTRAGKLQIKKIHSIGRPPPEIQVQRL